MQLKVLFAISFPIFFAGLLPVVSVGVNQVGRLNLGCQVGSLQYFTVCGLQEGYQPFAVNMARDPPLWMSWKQPQFTSIMPHDRNVQVSLDIFRGSFTSLSSEACVVYDAAFCSIFKYKPLWDLFVALVN